MHQSPLKVLLVEDNPADRKHVEILARKQLGQVSWGFAASLEQGLHQADGADWDVILLDLNLPDSRGLPTLARFLRMELPVPLIVLSGQGEEEAARASIREGAADYVPKDALSGDLLARSVRYALARAEFEAALQRANERIRQAEKLEAIGQLAGGIAHDFNNVLAIILGNVELATESSGQELLERLEDIREAGERAQGLTRQLLAFARKPEAERSEPVDLVELVRRCSSLLRSSAGSAVRLDVSLPPQPLWVRADPSQLEQVLLNLVVNARDAIHEHGRVQISVAARPLPASGCLVPEKEDHSQLMAELLVVDDGCGIEAELLPRIFDPFVTSKGPGEGTGLGLATVYGIVKQIGGVVDVESEVGAGATFTVRLPLAEVAPQHEASVGVNDPRCPRALGKETVLLVDDEVPLRRLVQRILEGLGYEVIAAEHPDAALQTLADPEQPLSLLITDVVMPEMDGRVLAKTAQELRPELPIVLTSGYIPGAKLGPVAGRDLFFLQKPVSREVLARAVRQVLDEAQRETAAHQRQPVC